MILDDEPLDWAVTTMADLSMDDFAAVLALGAAAVEFVLLGSGATQTLPPKAIREGLRAAGIGLEFMSTESAARTYNVLASEGRRVAAALIAI